MTTELEEKSKAKVAEERLKLSSARMNVVVFMTLLIDLLGFTVILPIMPKLLEFYGKEGSVSWNYQYNHIIHVFHYSIMNRNRSAESFSGFNQSLLICFETWNLENL